MRNSKIALRRRIRSLIGKRVQYVRVAGNSLILYFNGAPGSKSETETNTIWLDPPWRVMKDGLTQVESLDLDDRALKRGSHAAVCKRGPFKLSKQALRGFVILDEGHDLDLSFKNGFSVSKICVPSKEKYWVEWRFTEWKSDDCFEARYEKVTLVKAKKINAPLLPKRK